MYVYVCVYVYVHIYIHIYINMYRLQKQWGQLHFQHFTALCFEMAICQKVSKSPGGKHMNNPHHVFGDCESLLQISFLHWEDQLQMKSFSIYPPVNYLEENGPLERRSTYEKIYFSIAMWNCQKVFQYISIYFNIFQYISIYFNIFQYISIYFNIQWYSWNTARWIATEAERLKAMVTTVPSCSLQPSFGSFGCFPCSHPVRFDDKHQRSMTSMWFVNGFTGLLDTWQRCKHGIAIPITFSGSECGNFLKSMVWGSEGVTFQPLLLVQRFYFHTRQDIPMLHLRPSLGPGEWDFLLHQKCRLPFGCFT